MRPQAEVLPGFRGGYVPSGFRDGALSSGLVMLEVEREMWAPLYSARKRRQRLLSAALVLAVRPIPCALCPCPRPHAPLRRPPHKSGAGHLHKCSEGRSSGGQDWSGSRSRGGHNGRFEWITT